MARTTLGVRARLVRAGSGCRRVRDLARCDLAGRSRRHDRKDARGRSGYSPASDVPPRPGAPAVHDCPSGTVRRARHRQPRRRRARPHTFTRRSRGRARSRRTPDPPQAGIRIQARGVRPRLTARRGPRPRSRRACGSNRRRASSASGRSGRARSLPGGSTNSLPSASITRTGPSTLYGPFARALMVTSVIRPLYGARPVRPTHRGATLARS